MRSGRSGDWDGDDGDRGDVGWRGPGRGLPVAPFLCSLFEPGLSGGMRTHGRVGLVGPGRGLDR